MVKYLGIIFTLYAKDARQTATKVKRRQVSTWRYLLPIISIYWDFSETDIFCSKHYALISLKYLA